jgi:hypothetical protein
MAVALGHIRKPTASLPLIGLHSAIKMVHSTQTPCAVFIYISAKERWVFVINQKDSKKRDSLIYFNVCKSG